MFRFDAQLKYINAQLGYVTLQFTLLGYMKLLRMPSQKHGTTIKYGTGTR